MTLIMEKYKTLNPLNLSLFSANTVVMQSQNIANLIDKTGFIHSSLLLLLKLRFGSLTGTYMVDFIKSPNCPLLKVIFRGANCS